MTMFSVRLHGRGGQGVVTAAELLATAVFLGGAEAQAFPSFGSERMGAPVAAFCRIADQPIRVREPVLEPDAVIVLDRTLLGHVDLFSGLSRAGVVLLNCAALPDEPARADGGFLIDRGFPVPPEQVCSLDATDLARRCTGRPVPNVVMLGAFAALTGQVTVGSLERAVQMRFPDAADANGAALLAGVFAVRQVDHA